MNRRGALSVRAGLMTAGILAVAAAVIFVLLQERPASISPGGQATEDSRGDATPAPLGPTDPPPASQDDSRGDPSRDADAAAAPHLLVTVVDPVGAPVTGALVEWRRPGEEWNEAGHSRDEPLRLAAFDHPVVLRATWRSTTSVRLALPAGANGAHALIIDPSKDG